MYRVFVRNEDGSSACFTKDGYHFQWTVKTTAKAWEQAGTCVYQYNGRKGGGKAILPPRAQRVIALTKLAEDESVVVGHAGEREIVITRLSGESARAFGR